MFGRSSSAQSLHDPSKDASSNNGNTGGLLQGLRKTTLLAKMGRYGSSASMSALSPTPTLPLSSRSHSTSASLSLSLSPWLAEKQEILDARTRYFLVLMKRFQEQDCNLRQLEAELGDMLMQIQNACAAMTRTVEVFTQTFRYDAASYKLGVDYLAVIKMIGREGADMMEQSIRFTVLDPILARLERHNQLKASIQAWERIYSEVVELQLSLEQQFRNSRSEKDERRRKEDQQRLAEMQDQLAELQNVVTPRIGLILICAEETTDTYPAESQVQLFGAMRLQLAIFFYNANQSLFDGLSETETEMVRGPELPAPIATKAKTIATVTLPRSPPSASKPKRVLLSKNSVVSNASTENSTELESDESYLTPPASETEVDDDDCARVTQEENDDLELRASTSSITLEEFELGKSPPEALLPERDCTRMVRSLSYSDEASIHSGDIVSLLALASNPVVPDYSHDDAAYESYSDHQPEAERSDDDDGSERSSLHNDTVVFSPPGVFSTFRRSFQDKFTAAGKLDRQSSRTISDASQSSSCLDFPASSSEQFLPPNPQPLSPSEWRRIERCLWELDRNGGVPSPPKWASRTIGTPLTTTVAAKSKNILHQLVEQDNRVFFECTSYLPIEDIARLAKSGQLLHSTLRSCSSVWKQSIRTCDLSPSIRSSLWLSIFYGQTPWQMKSSANDATAAPHHLSDPETRAKIYEQLLVKVGSRMANSSLVASETGNASPSPVISEENQQMLVWLQEIDVDVTRTCNKDIYAKDVANDWSAAFGMPTESSTDINSTNSSEQSIIEALVESALLTPSLAIKSSCESPTSSSSPSPKQERPRSATDDSPKSVVEAKIRRILRAYAMYNPRVGYCQGMNFLVRMLLEVTENEADVFWLFVGLSEPEINCNLYEPGLTVLQPLLAKFELLVSYHMPELFVHFQREGVHVAAFSTRWFMTMFSSFETFGPTLVLRLLDMFVIDGWRVLLSMGLVVLDELREALLKAELEDIHRMLQCPRSFMIEPDHARRRQLVRHALAFCTTRAINTL